MLYSMKIELGDKVRDEVSGFEGIVLAKMEALYEASQCRVHPTELKSDGEMRDSKWIEEGRLKPIEKRPCPGFQMPPPKK